MSKKINNASIKPFVSVIMPVFNEESFISKSLQTIIEQNYPKNLMEIIIADGMSTDKTREIIAQKNFESDVSITIVDNPRKIAPTGLNCAIRASRGEVIVRVDGHCEIEPDYVENCVKHLSGGAAQGVGGPIETIGETARAKAIAAAMSSKFGVGGSAFRTIDNREMFVDTVAFPGYKRELFEKVGFFNEELVRNQDDEFNYRVRKNGGKILLSPDIRSRYYSRSSFKSLWKQYFQYGYWKVRVMQMHPRQMSLRQFIPFLFVASLILTALLSIFVNVFGWVLLAIIAAYLIADFTATLLTAKNNLTYIPALFLSFAILHFSYGSGFLLGLIVFAGKWGAAKNKNTENV